MFRKKQQEAEQIEETPDSKAEIQPEGKPSRMTFGNAIRYGAAAVAFVVLVSALTVIPQINFDKLIKPSGGQTASVSSTAPAGSEPAASAPANPEPNKEPTFNSILHEQWSSNFSYDSELYNEHIWNRSQVLTYLGKGIRPAMPMDLKESDRKSWAIYTKKEDAAFAYDYFQFIFSENFDDTYQPDRRKISIGVSKLGISGDCTYVMDGQELTVLNGVEMTLGYRELEDGCIIMAAYFVTAGLRYEVSCENLTQNEFLQILNSIA